MIYANIVAFIDAGAILSYWIPVVVRAKIILINGDSVKGGNISVWNQQGHQLVWQDRGGSDMLGGFLHKYSKKLIIMRGRLEHLSEYFSTLRD
jgi:hypothetical protein